MITQLHSYAGVARRFPYIKGRKHNAVDWVQIVNNEHNEYTFHGHAFAEAEKLFGAEQYMATYGKGVNLGEDAAGNIRVDHPSVGR